MNWSLAVLKTWATSVPSSAGRISSSAALSPSPRVPNRWTSAGLSPQVVIRSSNSLTPRSFLVQTHRTGTSLPRGDGVVRGLAQLLNPDRLTLQVAHHELLVGLDDLLDHHLVGLGGRQRAARRVVIVLLDHVDDPRERRPLADRHVERHALEPEGLADRPRGRPGSRRSRRPSW